MISVADFHNHSCLSPCGSLELSPTVLVAEAVKKGVQILALTDHNCARNTPAFEVLCRESGVLGLFGLEVTTAEELHCLVLFETSRAAMTFGQMIEDHLMKIPLRPEKHGDQVVVNAAETVLEEVPFWLGAPTDLGLTSLVHAGQSAGGLVIPAHIDRPAQSVTSQLGYLPDAPYDALEVREGPGRLDIRGHTLVRGSDAHYVENIASRTCWLDVGEFSFRGVQEALRRGRVGF